MDQIVNKLRINVRVLRTDYDSPQCPPGDKHRQLFTHIGHEHQQCSLKRA